MYYYRNILKLMKKNFKKLIEIVKEIKIDVFKPNEELKKKKYKPIEKY